MFLLGEQYALTLAVTLAVICTPFSTQKYRILYKNIVFLKYDD